MKKQKIELWEEIRIRRVDTGWDFYFCGTRPSICGLMENRADTFDAVVARIKEQFDVEPRQSVPNRLPAERHRHNAAVHREMR
ncbi:MAG: hypothetical protein QHC90_22825 [Shinella sp.]|nr:hypothetical protein [Shinella sp.]